MITYEEDAHIDQEKADRDAALTWRISAQRDIAFKAGNKELVELCTRAIHGHEDAIEECLRVLPVAA